MAKKKIKKKAGCSTKWQSKYIAMAEKICAAAGFNIGQLADFFGVSESTIANWKNKYPAFAVAIRDGSRQFDSENVQAALLKLALGYKTLKRTMEAEENELENIKTPADFDSCGGLLKKIELIEHAPHFAAIKFWLQKRDPENWADTAEGENLELPAISIHLHNDDKDVKIPVENSENGR
ncbi:MAG: hypothetical protein JEZ07_20340 [Phycisphaerae bacterium]|nr:hypothetical protein [Phycisphaerae bacterium]